MKLLEATEHEHILRALGEDLPTHDAGQCVQCLAARHPRAGSAVAPCVHPAGPGNFTPAPLIRLDLVYDRRVGGVTFLFAPHFWYFLP
jgi:hypothetical protein